MSIPEHISLEPIEKGWSSDKKYKMRMRDGSLRLLRVSPRGKHPAELYALMRRAACLGVPMCDVYEFGECAEGDYSVQRWIDGVDLESALADMDELSAYDTGGEAGRILRKIHSIPAPDGVEDWEARFGRKLDKKLAAYAECPLKYEDGEALAGFIAENRALLAGRPQVFQHGDYHVGNMMLERGRLTIIDFDRHDFGDPWEEFNRIVWCAQASPAFASGMVNAYFDDDVPDEFWYLLALYVASNTLSSLPWALPFGEDEVKTMRAQCREVLSWYDGMRRVIPSWYRPGRHTQALDGVEFKLRAEFDFSFMARYGRVFKVFDDQDSGNICFGAEKDGVKRFIKFAGAPTCRYRGDISAAVERLRTASEAARALSHPLLARLITAEDIGGGFAAVYEWSEGVGIGRMFPEAHARFMALDIEKRLAALDCVLDFHIHAANMGYVAIDFYDGSILYDFETGQTRICDVDFYAKAPYFNPVGRMWGSGRFMAPEEYEKGAAIDERTNVFAMGSAAFSLIADSDFSRAAWQLSDAAFSAASRARAADREARFSTIAEFADAWRASIGR